LDNEQPVIMKLPSDLARELIEHKLAEPYLRRERVDTSLVVQIVITATSTATTVIVAKLTEDSSKAIAKAITTWVHRHSKDKTPATLTVRGTRSDEISELQISDSTTENEIADKVARLRPSNET
jgi:hypothetical protein